MPTDERSTGHLCEESSHLFVIFLPLQSNRMVLRSPPKYERLCRLLCEDPPPVPPPPVPATKKKVTVGFVCGDGGRQATHSETFLEEAALFFL